MAVEGGAKCVKYLLFFFNFIFWLAGLALIIIGVVVQVKLNKSILITDFEASGAPIVIIAVGVIIFFIAFFGCCGAWKESYCLVTTFAVLLTLIFLVEIAAAIAGYVFKDKVTMYLEKGFEEAMKNYTTVAESRDAVDEMQKMFKCCGSHNSTSWQFYFRNSSVPDSCCKNETAGCGKSPKLEDLNSEGCIGVIDKWIKNNVLIVAGVALGIAFFQILGIIFACLLMKGIRSGYEVM